VHGTQDCDFRIQEFLRAFVTKVKKVWQSKTRAGIACLLFSLAACA
jgi:hypothetical protein